MVEDGRRRNRERRGLISESKQTLNVFYQESEDDEIEFDGAANEGEIKKVEPAAAKVAVEEVKAVEVVNEETGEAEEIDIDDI